MPSLSRAASLPLRPFVLRVWASDAQAGEGVERVLPTGCMHLVVRLSPEPLTLFEAGRPHTVGTSVIGGARSTAYVRSLAGASRSVGAQLAPGAASLLLGVPASALAEAHTSLESVWGAAAVSLRDRLGEARTLEERLARFESALIARLPRERTPNAVVAHAVARLRRDARIADVVEESGYSHRAFLALFRGAVGLAPKAFGRVVRSQRAVGLLGERRSLAEVAAGAGYADQAHFTREFAAINGLTPARFRKDSPDASNHVRVRGQ